MNKIATSEPANCIGLIKIASPDNKNLWFVASNHEVDHNGEDFVEDTGQTPYIKPLPRSEVEEFLKGFEPYLIVEVPT